MPDLFWFVQKYISRTHPRLGKSHKSEGGGMQLDPFKKCYAKNTKKGENAEKKSGKMHLPKKFP